MSDISMRIHFFVSGYMPQEELVSVTIKNTGTNSIAMSDLQSVMMWKSNVLTIRKFSPAVCLRTGDAVTHFYQLSQVVGRHSSLANLAFICISDDNGRQRRINIAPFYKAWPHRLILWALMCVRLSITSCRYILSRDNSRLIKRFHSLLHKARFFS